MQSPVYEIDTPENVRFSFERAGLASRATAWAIDVLVMGCLLQLGSLLVSPFELIVGNAANALWLVIVFLVQWWYGALCEWRFSGRTVGKRALGLATIDDKGLPLTLYQAVIRNLIRMVDFLPGLYFVGGVTALLDARGRRLGDLAASTLVIRERRGRVPRRALAEAQRDLARYPGLVEAGRRLTPQERDAVLGLCAERDKLPLPLRAELFGTLAAHLQARLQVSWPPHLTAEKLVLYIGAALASRETRAARDKPAALR